MRFIYLVAVYTVVYLRMLFCCCVSLVVKLATFCVLFGFVVWCFSVCLVLVGCFTFCCCAWLVGFGLYLG